MHRPRWIIIGSLLLVIAVGLASRASWMPPGFWADNAGDALWALCVYLGFLLLFPKLRVPYAALCAFGVAAAVECQQLIQWPWLVQVRGTLPGQLLLGSGFVWVDFVRYGAGVLFGAAVDWGIQALRK